MQQQLTPRNGLYVILLVTVLATIRLISVYDGSLLPNDTAQYLSVARHLVAGEGLKTDLVFFSEHLALGSMPVEQTVFPPGYPLLITLPVALGFNVPDAAFVVTASAFALTPIILYLLGSSLGQAPGLALASSLFWIGLVDNWFITLERQPEMPFILCTLLALLFLPRDRTGSRSRTLMAGLFAAAAILIRYAGIFFVVAVVVGFAIHSVRRRSGRSWPHWVTFLTPPVLTALWLFWRNQQLVGDIRGGNAYQEIKPLGLVVLKFYKALCHILGFTGNGLRSMRVGEVLLVLFIFVALVVWFRNRGSLRWDRRLSPPPLGDPRWAMAAGYVAISIVLLFYLEMTTSLEFQPRMVLVLAPFALVVCAQVVSAMEVTSAQARRDLMLLVVFLCIVFVAGQRNVLHQMRSRPNLYQLVDTALHTKLEDTSARQLLQAAVTAEHPLLGNEPQMLGAVLEGPVVGLEPPYYTDRSWTAGEVHELVERYGIEYVAFLPEAFEASSERPGFFVELAHQRQPEWLETVLDEPALRLYRVVAGEPR